MHERVVNKSSVDFDIWYEFTFLIGLSKLMLIFTNQFFLLFRFNLFYFNYLLHQLLLSFIWLIM